MERPNNVEIHNIELINSDILNKLFIIINKINKKNGYKLKYYIDFYKLTNKPIFLYSMSNKYSDDIDDLLDEYFELPNNNDNFIGFDDNNQPFLISSDDIIKYKKKGIIPNNEFTYIKKYWNARLI
jgi:hypothetical protein